MGNCLVIPPDGTKRTSISVGVDQDLEGKQQLSKDSSSDFENHVEVFKNIKKVRFANDQQYFGGDEGIDGNERAASRSVRIKVVMSKKELLEMLERGGAARGDDVVGKSRRLINDIKANADDHGFDGWKPGLESTSEAIYLTYEPCTGSRHAIH